jgi:hypothetical protein
MRRHISSSTRYVIYGFWYDHFRRNVRPCANTHRPFCTPLPVVIEERGQFGVSLFSDPFRAVERARVWDEGGSRDSMDWVTARMEYDALLSRFGVTDVAPDQFSEWEIVAATFLLGEMAAHTKLHGAKFVVVYIPSYFQSPAPIPKPLENWLRKNNIQFVDAWQILDTMISTGESPGIPGDFHLTARAHRLIGDAVHAHVRK